MLSLFYITAQQINVVRDFIYSYFYSFKDTKSTTYNSIIATAVHVTISIVLVNFVGVYGIVFGTMITSMVSLITIMIRFKVRFGYGERVVKIVFQYIKTLLLTAVTVGGVLATKYFLPLDNGILTILVYGVATVGVYLLLTFLFNRKVIQVASQI